MDTLVNFLNRAGQSFVTFHSAMWLQSTVLILILLLLDRLLRQRVRAVVRYWIWMLVLVKLLLPTTLTSPIGMGQFIPTTTPSTHLTPSAPSNASLATVQPSAPAVQPPASATTSHPIQDQPSTVSSITEYRLPITPLSWQGITFLIWLATVTVMLMILAYRLWSLKKLLRVAVPAHAQHHDLLDETRKQLGVVQSVRLKIIPMPGSPSVVGLWHPTILLPQNMLTKLNESHLRSIFLHELAHIKRGDLWISMIQTLIQIAYCYDLLLWIANAVIRNVREQAVDETVLVTLGAQADDYPRTLMDISKLSFQRSALSLHLIGVVESKKALFERIKYIATSPIPTSTRLGVMECASLLFMAVVLLPMAQGERATPELTLGEFQADSADADYSGGSELMRQYMDALLNNKDESLEQLTATATPQSRQLRLTFNEVEKIKMQWGNFEPSFKPTCRRTLSRKESEQKCLIGMFSGGRIKRIDGVRYHLLAVIVQGKNGLWRIKDVQWYPYDQELIMSLKILDRQIIDMVMDLVDKNTSTLSPQEKTDMEE